MGRVWAQSGHTRGGARLAVGRRRFELRTPRLIGGTQAVLSRTDRLDDINAAYADVEDARPHVGGRREARRIVLDKPDAPLAGEDAEHPQRLSSHHANSFFTHGLSRARMVSFRQPRILDVIGRW